ncbi:MAG: hypothetical protein WCT42_01080 [Candidatus Paceibacterota bacterium]|jgi:hypothetical protein
MNSKNNTIIAVVVIIILAIVAIVALKSRNQKNEVVPLTQSEIELNKAVESDTTVSINENLNSIEVNDTTGNDELKTVDKELQNL